ncbi:DUF803-domain-containing protein [Violaceomyces palustris]|uniref:DUF803-domain-containing protein n=1 Tax=Violaceomyces palustris TaxID=1673888 RepID=A0ACD0NYU2_9BASI|nr:DUF803-domain-containing protein [Violaceomyces palustris]
MSTTTITSAPLPTSSAALDSAASQSIASEAVASLSKVIASASAALHSESAIAAGESLNPPEFKYVGLALAVGSGLLIGSSFVFKKKGLLSSQKKYETSAGEGHAYLKSPMWWTGMIIMVLGEVFNFVAYAFADAVLVTPLGALSVVVCAILSSIFLKEKLTLFGKVGCFLCIVGSVIIALNAPSQHAGGKITEFQKLFLAPGFLVWAGLCIATSLVLVFFVAPKYGKRNMMVYITVCSLIGGLSVSCTSGLGSAILLSIRGQNQFKHWFVYFLLGFVIVTLLVEINYLNKALELFNTATVTPTYYVLFTGATLITSIILFQGLKASAIGIVTIVMGFLVICAGIALLQISKIDPDDLQDKPGLDRGTTLLIRASRSQISHTEKGDTTGIEDPGVDSVRGGLGIVGSMIRARSSRRLSTHGSFGHGRHHSAADEYTLGGHGMVMTTHGSGSIERFQLHDTPMLSERRSSLTAQTFQGMPSRRDTAISFAEGSDLPHGHHQHPNSAPVQQQPQQASGHGLGAIKEASGGSSGDQSSKYLDPYRPSTTTFPGSSHLPRSGAADNIRNMWGGGNSSTSLTPGGSISGFGDSISSNPSPGLSPTEESIKELGRGTASPEDTEEEDVNEAVKSGPDKKVKGQKSWPRPQSSGGKNSRTGSRGRVSNDSEEEEELLSPRLGYGRNL